jgi:hypothetical protein
MPRHLILHIGLTKTGSTSIQHVLAAAREAMEQQGVYYPRNAGYAEHPLLALACVNDPTVPGLIHRAIWKGMAPAARVAAFRAGLDAEMRSLPEDARCVMSSEHISRLLRTPGEVDRLAVLLRPYFGVIEVVVYLRRQDQHAASAYAERLRGGLLAPAALPQGGPGELPHYDYARLLDLFGGAFGADHLRPRVFDRDSLSGGDVVTDFLATSGISVAMPADLPGRQSNVRLSLLAQTLLLRAGTRFARQTKRGPLRNQAQWWRLAQVAAQRLPGPGWRPTRGEAAAFMKRFADSNESVRLRYFPQRAALFGDDLSDLPDGEETVTDAALADAALDVLVRMVLEPGGHDPAGRDSGAAKLPPGTPPVERRVGRRERSAGARITAT